MKVEETGDERVLLNDSFGPIWTFLQYNGILFDFCCPTKENGLSYKTRFIYTVFVALIVWSYAALQSVHLIIGMWSTSSSEFDVCSLFGIVAATSAGIALYQYSIHWKKFQQFFIDWKKVEIQCSEFSNSIKTKKVVRRLYMMYLIMLISSLMLFYYLNINFPDWSIFFSYYPLISDTFNIYFISWVNTINFYYIYIYYYLCEVIPALFFYHAGCLVENLVRMLYHTTTQLHSKHRHVVESTNSVSDVNIEIDVQYPNQKSFRLICNGYQTVIRFVNEVNNLFAVLIICSQLRSFFMNCTLFYASFKCLVDSSALTSIVSFLFLTEILRTVFVNRLMSHLYLSRIELQDTLADLLSTKWYLLSEKDREFLLVFQSRLNKGEVGACPFNLYTIKPTNLLSMLSLIVTYTIALIQTGT